MDGWGGGLSGCRADGLVVRWGDVIMTNEPMRYDGHNRRIIAAIGAMLWGYLFFFCFISPISIRGLEGGWQHASNNTR
jgi:hypothetical protein